MADKRKDYNQYQNRQELSQQLMKIKLDTLGLIFIRMLAFMEVGEHKDRQTFWEQLEKYLREKQPGQMTIDQVLTKDKKADYPTLTERVLDKVYKKV